MSRAEIRRPPAPPNSIGQLVQKGAQNTLVSFEGRWQLEEQRSQLLFKPLDHTEQVVQRVAAISEFREVGDTLGRLQAEGKVFGGRFVPVLNGLSAGNSPEGVVDLCGGKSFRVKRKHFGGGPSLRIKYFSPFRVLVARGADPELHSTMIARAAGLPRLFLDCPSRNDFAACGPGDRGLGDC